MTAKLKTRIKSMTFQKNVNRRIEVEKNEETKYYEEMYKKRTTELLGIKHENICRTTRGRLRPEYI
jgi:hypothetical protein